jgi:hypothetical protein
MHWIYAHLIGDYLIQNDWMATNKTKHSGACLIHAALYTLPFIALTQGPPPLLAIAGTHFVIDRWRLALRLVQLKNWNWSPTGFPGDRPPFLTVWVTILVDNTLHLLINYLVLR